MTFVYKRHVVRLKTTRSLSVRNGSERVNKRETCGESCSTFHSEIFARFSEKRSQQFRKTAPSLLFKYGLSSSHFLQPFLNRNPTAKFPLRKSIIARVFRRFFSIGRSRVRRESSAMVVSWDSIFVQSRLTNGANILS